jgi:hypothetical protein
MDERLAFTTFFQLQGSKEGLSQRTLRRFRIRRIYFAGGSLQGDPPEIF